MFITLSLILALFSVDDAPPKQQKTKNVSIIQNMEFAINGDKSTLYQKMPTKLIKIK
tara:strand:- start:247 stop:417 length:171 start_codon:yes stop_codon:yes gene_type:complete